MRLPAIVQQNCGQSRSGLKVKQLWPPRKVFCAHLLVFSCSHFYSFMKNSETLCSLIVSLSIKLATESVVSWGADWKRCVFEVGQMDELISRLKSEPPCCKSDVLAQRYDRPCQLDGIIPLTCYSMLRNGSNWLGQVSSTPEACLQLLELSSKVFFWRLCFM